MTRINGKPPVYDDPGVALLRKLSKDCLVDFVIDILRGDDIEKPVSLDRVKERIAPVLALRGDRMPVVK